MSTTNKLLVSIIIPLYNEEKTIRNCVESLLNQTIINIEIIMIDDGSRDKTLEIVNRIKRSLNKNNLIIASQKHKGPGEARNLGAKYAKGKILVFVDADMKFDNKFVQELIKPIIEKKAIGTDSQSEYLENPTNYWARCWNIGRFSAAGVFNERYKVSMVPNTVNSGGIFRAILKKDFNKVGGFEAGGDYTDDESLVKRIGTKATLANKAKFYHYNPDSLLDVVGRASWIGSGKSFTASAKLRFINLIKFSVPFSIAKGLFIGFRYNYLKFVYFKIVFDFAVWWSVLKSL